MSTPCANEDDIKRVLKNAPELLLLREPGDTTESLVGRDRLLDICWFRGSELPRDPSWAVVGSPLLFHDLAAVVVHGNASTILTVAAHPADILSIHNQDATMAFDDHETTNPQNVAVDVAAFAGLCAECKVAKDIDGWAGVSPAAVFCAAHLEKRLQLRPSDLLRFDANHNFYVSVVAPPRSAIFAGDAVHYARRADVTLAEALRDCGKVLNVNCRLPPKGVLQDCRTFIRVNPDASLWWLTGPLQTYMARAQTKPLPTTKPPPPPPPPPPSPPNQAHAVAWFGHAYSESGADTLRDMTASTEAKQRDNEAFKKEIRRRCPELLYLRFPKDLSVSEKGRDTMKMHMESDAQGFVFSEYGRVVGTPLIYRQLATVVVVRPHAITLCVSAHSDDFFALHCDYDSFVSEHAYNTLVKEVSFDTFYAIASECTVARPGSVVSGATPAAACVQATLDISHKDYVTRVADLTMPKIQQGHRFYLNYTSCSRTTLLSGEIITRSFLNGTKLSEENKAIRKEEPTLCKDGASPVAMGQAVHFLQGLDDADTDWLMRPLKKWKKKWAPAISAPAPAPAPTAAAEEEEQEDGDDVGGIDHAELLRTTAQMAGSDITTLEMLRKRYGELFLMRLPRSFGDGAFRRGVEFVRGIVDRRQYGTAGLLTETTVVGGPLVLHTLAAMVDVKDNAVRLTVAAPYPAFLLQTLSLDCDRNSSRAPSTAEVSLQEFAEVAGRMMAAPLSAPLKPEKYGISTAALYLSNLVLLGGRGYVPESKLKLNAQTRYYIAIASPPRSIISAGELVMRACEKSHGYVKDVDFQGELVQMQATFPEIKEYPKQARAAIPFAMGRASLAKTTAWLTGPLNQRVKEVRVEREKEKQKEARAVRVLVDSCVKTILRNVKEAQRQEMERREAQRNVVLHRVCARRIQWAWRTSMVVERRTAFALVLQKHAKTWARRKGEQKRRERRRALEQTKRDALYADKLAREAAVLAEVRGWNAEKTAEREEKLRERREIARQLEVAEAAEAKRLARLAEKAAADEARREAAAKKKRGKEKAEAKPDAPKTKTKSKAMPARVTAVTAVTAPTPGASTSTMTVEEEQAAAAVAAANAEAFAAAAARKAERANAIKTAARQREQVESVVDDAADENFALALEVALAESLTVSQPQPEPEPPSMPEPPVTMPPPPPVPPVPPVPTVPTVPTPTGAEPPAQLVCPLSLNLMSDPVTLLDGHTYERQDIEMWLASNDTSPLTGLALPSKTLVPALAIRSLCASWREDHPTPDDEARPVRAVDGATVVMDHRFPPLP